jgi:hypothetical protein
MHCDWHATNENVTYNSTESTVPVACKAHMSVACLRSVHVLNIRMVLQKSQSLENKVEMPNMKADI